MWPTGRPTPASFAACGGTCRCLGVRAIGNAQTMRTGHATALLFVLFALPPLAAENAPDRARQIQDKLLAPCCYAESLAVHRSELAARLRSEIRGAVKAGRTDREIIDGYIAQYGLRILREPEGQRSTWLHIVPIALVTLGIVAFVLVLRHLRESGSPRATAPERADVRIDEELW
jgi:cytochrome c-type biogenesis protein CcmH